LLLIMANKRWLLIPMTIVLVNIHICGAAVTHQRE
jgi:hypothetical protein